MHSSMHEVQRTLHLPTHPTATLHIKMDVQRHIRMPCRTDHSGDQSLGKAVHLDDTARWSVQVQSLANL